MKLLTIIRHAKSVADFLSNDFDRKNTSRGINDAKKVAEKSKDYINPESFIWSSSAVRTTETATIFLSVWKLDFNTIDFKKELYTFDSTKLEQIIKSCPNDCDNLILFGHNNAITDFVNKFGDIFIDNVPTSGFVSIIFDTNNWNEINKGKTDKIIFPRVI